MYNGPKLTLIVNRSYVVCLIIAGGLHFLSDGASAGAMSVNAGATVPPGGPTWCVSATPCINIPIDFTEGTDGWVWEREHCDPCSSCCPDEGCHPPNARVRVILFDCNGNEIDRKEEEIDTCCCAGSDEAPFGDDNAGGCDINQGEQNNPLDFTFDVCNGAIPKTYRVEVFDGMVSDPGCGVEFAWNQTAEGIIPPPDLTCSYSLDALKCLACEPARMPQGMFKVYKTLPTQEDAEPLVVPVYTIRESDLSGARLGEAVNGVFLFPGAGQLRFEILDTPNAGTSSLEIRAGTMPNAAGWSGVGGRMGNLIQEQVCIDSEENDSAKRFEFNASVGRGDKVATVHTMAHWFYTEDTDCCIRYLTKKVDFQIRPLPCDRQVEPPARPQIKVWAKESDNGLSYDYEMCTPCCGSCSGGSACSIGNLSSPYILWPTTPGLVVRQGHAKGWQFTGSNLIMPDSAATTFVFGQ